MRDASAQIGGTELIQILLNLTVNALEHLERPAGRLILQTLRSHDQFNSTIYGLSDRYRGIENGRRVVFLHQDDIAAHGFETVELFAKPRRKVRIDQLRLDGEHEPLVVVDVNRSKSFDCQFRHLYLSYRLRMVGIRYSLKARVKS